MFNAQTPPLLSLVRSLSQKRKTSPRGRGSAWRIWSRICCVWFFVPMFVLKTFTFIPTKLSAYYRHRPKGSQYFKTCVVSRNPFGFPIRTSGIRTFLPSDTWAATCPAVGTKKEGKCQTRCQVLSPTSLPVSRSVGTGRREPWEKGGVNA